MSGLDDALALADRGWHVFPVDHPELAVCAGLHRPGTVCDQRGKHPAVRFTKEATTDPKMIAAWWAGATRNAGVYCRASGLLVVDEDAPGALDRYAADQGVTVPATYTVTTAKGQHRYFTAPAGVELGNHAGALAAYACDVRAGNAYVVGSGSVHATGVVYTATDDREAASAPGWLVDALQDRRTTASTPPGGEAAWTTVKVPAGGLAAAPEVITAGTRHDAIMRYAASMRARDIPHAEAVALVESVWRRCDQPPGKPYTLAEAMATLADVYGRYPAGRSDDGCTIARGARELAGAARPGPERLAALGALLANLRTWQHLPDPVHVIVALAAAATRKAEGEPCWVLLVAPPSSGKTETARLLDEVADARLDEVTAAGLLGWSKGKVVRPSGVLSRIDTKALVTFGDLSSLLATSDRGGRDQVFGLLRRAYDGHVTRDVSPPGKVESVERLEWSGRLTVVACVTGAIDRYAAHADQLGPRWVYVRIADRSTKAKRAAAELARRGDLARLRSETRGAVQDLLAGVPADLPQLPEWVADAIEDAALVTAWGRGSVPRHGYGRRELDGVPVVEEPMRLVQQLGAVARGVIALGLPDQAAAAIARRVALDSMPASRRAVLHALSTSAETSTAACARAAGLDRKVARMALEELEAIGVVENDRVEDEAEELVGVVRWRLKGDDGAIIAATFEAFRESSEGWDETWVYTSTSPQEKDIAGVSPTLRPTRDAA